MWDGSQLTCARIGRLFSSDSKSHDMTWHDHSAYIDRSRTSSSDLYRSVSVSSSSYSYTVPAKLSKREEDAAVACGENNKKQQQKREEAKDRQMDGWNTRRTTNNVGRERRKEEEKCVVTFLLWILELFSSFVDIFRDLKFDFPFYLLYLFCAANVCGWDNWDISLG